MEIIPSILTKSVKEFKSMLKRAEFFAPSIHVDICDGEFVKNKTIDYSDLRGISPQIPWSFHLMVKDPLKVIDKYLALSPVTIYIHAESNNVEETLLKIKSYGIVKPGLVLNPQTSTDLVVQYENILKAALVMTVEPGFYGSKFKFEDLHKVEELKEMQIKGLKVGVDGGASERIKTVKSYNPDFVVSGSYIWNQGKSPVEQYEKLLGL
jgi:ribulose-phosphate 3-epimerase